MARRVTIDGVPHRLRRGRLVAIPARWVGVVPHGQERRGRQRDAREMRGPRGIRRFRPDARGQEAARRPAWASNLTEPKMTPYDRRARRTRQRDAILESIDGA